MEEICWDEIEPDPFYEYDAPQFFDFDLRESDLEVGDADRWFDTAQDYPPFPFDRKIYWRDLEKAYRSMRQEDGEDTCSVDRDSNTSSSNQIVEMNDNHGGTYSLHDSTPNTPKFKTKAFGKPSTSTLMRPTASYLAKQKHRQEVNSFPSHGRSQKSEPNSDKFSRSSSLIESQTTKRQKLDSGYLSKAPQLKCHTFIHKVANKPDVSSTSTRLKVTVPREPNLATAHRAQRYRSTSTASSKQENIENIRVLKARPLNKKEFKVPTDKRLRHNLPIDAFSKLSLTSKTLPATK